MSDKCRETRGRNGNTFTRLLRIYAWDMSSEIVGVTFLLVSSNLRKRKCQEDTVSGSQEIALRPKEGDRRKGVLSKGEGEPRTCF